MVYTFIVILTDETEDVYGRRTKCFTDYAAGWDWARREGRDWELLDAHSRYKVICKNAWEKDDPEFIKRYCEYSKEKNNFEEG